MTSAVSDALDATARAARWRRRVLDALARPGTRLAGLYCSHNGDDDRVVIHALIAEAASITRVSEHLDADATGRIAYPALSPGVPAAFWYERALHDLSGVIPVGHPRLERLLLPPNVLDDPPRPGRAVAQQQQSRLHGVDELGPVDLQSPGIFSLPYGPVRSGVSESIEFLIETPGEDIPYLTIRPHYKHRGLAKRFEGLTPSDAVLVAERVEGVATVAHALAFSHAVENAAHIDVPDLGKAVRVIHAELERIATHLDVVAGLCEAAGLAVAVARFTWHKENVMRSVSALCGNRFGRSVVVPGGVAHYPELTGGQIVDALTTITARVRSDRDELMDTSTFLDRLRGTGRLDPGATARHGALGPIGRACAVSNDCRIDRPYDDYREFGMRVSARDTGGDVLARLNVRWQEMDTSTELIIRAAHRLSDRSGERFAGVPDSIPDGVGLGWAEAAAGEVLYSVHFRGGPIERCFARSPALHNLLLFRHAFGSDIFTDFAFIEASFGLSYAGVAM